MVRTEIRFAAVLQGVWLPTSPQAALGQVKALRRLQPDADISMVASETRPPPQQGGVDLKV